MFLSYPNNTYNQIKPSFPRKKREVLYARSHLRSAQKCGSTKARSLAKRKPAGERPLDAMIVVRMTDKQKAFFKMAGGSAWLRRVLEVCMERKQFNMASDRDPNEKELLGGLEIDDILPESLSSKSTGF